MPAANDSASYRVAVTSELSDLRKLHAMQKAINDAKEEQVRLARERRLSESLASGWKRLRAHAAWRRHGRLILKAWMCQLQRR